MADAPPHLHTTATSMEDWRMKALNLSAHDRLGHLLSRALEVMMMAARDGASEQNLAYNLKSLEKERRLAMQFDENRNDPLRELVYGMCESFGEMMDAIKERTSNDGDQATSEFGAFRNSNAMSISPAEMKIIKEECMDAALENHNNFPPTLAHLRPSREASMDRRSTSSAMRESLMRGDNATSSNPSTTSRKRPATGSTPVTVERPRRSTAAVVSYADADDGEDEMPAAAAEPAATAATAEATAAAATAVIAAHPLLAAALAGAPTTPSSVALVAAPSTPAAAATVAPPTTHAAATVAARPMRAAARVATPATPATAKQAPAGAAAPSTPATTKQASATAAAPPTSAAVVPVVAPPTPAAAAAPPTPTARVAAPPTSAARVAAAAKFRDVKQYACDQCDRSFDAVDCLRRHAVMHSGHQCYICGLHTKDDLKMQRHLWVVHGPVIQTSDDGEITVTIPKAKGVATVTVTIPKAKGVTTSTVTADDEITSSMTDNDDEEETIPKTPKTEETLETDRSSRRSIVKSDRRFKCDQCAWSFDKPSALNAHKLWHSDTKEHSCSHCPDTFRTESVLKHHLREAHGVAPFGCSGVGCADRFMRKEDEMQHRKSCAAAAAAAAAARKAARMKEAEKKKITTEESTGE